MEAELLPAYALGSALFSYAAATIVTAFVLQALASLARGRSIDYARQLLVQGMLAGLSLTAAATLLRLLTARGWNDVAMIAVLLTLRTGLKQALAWEQRRLALSTGPQQGSPKRTGAAATSPSAPLPSE